MFDKKGQIIIDKEECDMDADDLMMTALDAGAEDFSEEEDSFEVLTDPDAFERMSARHWRMQASPWHECRGNHDPADLRGADLTRKMSSNLQRTLDLLEDDDDVQAVYHNWDE